MDNEKNDLINLIRDNQRYINYIPQYKEAGRYLGRPRIEYPENWEDCYSRWKAGVITAKEAMTLLGLKKDSFYRLVKKYEGGH